jgi:tetratricopeptide (TPR) repeat protein
VRRALAAAVLAALSAACSSVPKNDADWYDEVMLDVSEGRNKDALELLDQVVKKKPDDPWAWANRGTVLLNLKRPEDAAISYRRALQFQPNSPHLMTCMSTAAYKWGRLLDSVDWADKALGVDPGFAPAMAQKAQALKGLKRDAEAAALFKKAFQIDASLESQFEQ